MSKNSRLVYSTDKGRIKDSDAAPETLLTGDGVVRLHRETKGRKGKGVTLIKGLILPEDKLKALAKKIKQQCGVGGSVKEGIIEMQTDDRDKLKTILEKEGFNVKISGG
jgi:translation initiation factor 1